MKRLFSFLVLLPITISAQNGWTRWHGTGWGQWDCAHWIEQTSDGGYIATGWCGYSIIALLKLDGNGDTVWARTYDRGRGYCVQQTNDGGYMIVGYKETYEEENQQLCLIKTDSEGNINWSRIYGGSESEVGRSFQQTADGGYVIVGYTESFGRGKYNLWLLKTNEWGDTVWSHVYDIEEWSQGYSVQEAKDGGYAVVGYRIISGEAGTHGVWLLRTDPLGDTLWTKTYWWGKDDYGYSLDQTSDGGYAICGASSSFTSSYRDLLVIKTNASGDTLWTRVINGTNWDLGYCIRQTLDGAYIITGEAATFGEGGNTLWLIKLDSQGNDIWSRTYGAGGESGLCVQQTSDSGYVVVGRTGTFGNGSGFWFTIKTDPEGRIPVEISPTSSRDIGREIYPRRWFIPNGYFYNLGTYNYPYDFYCHCEITGIDNHNADYHDSVLVNGIKPFQRVVIDFAEWKTIYSSTYEITYYVTPATGPDFPSRPMSGYFYWDAIEEQPVAEPGFEVINTVGREIVLRYTDSPKGFHASIFDASGCKVDEMNSNLKSGTIEWGEGFDSGVYFVRVEDGSLSSVQKVVLIR